MNKKYNWATLGTGVIAKELALALKEQGRTLYAVANRTHEKGVAFAKEYGIQKVYDKIEDVFSDEKVDIIYVSTPHNTHINYIRQALRAGKHVLCEKSITLNSEELEEVIKLAKNNNLVLAEAMTIFHMPLYQAINDYLAKNEWGKPSLITMNFGSYKEYDMNNRFFNKNLAGGALLDIGVYALSFTRWFMSEKPDQIFSQVNFAPTGVDEKVSILLKNPGGEMATIMLSLHTKQPKRGTVAFDKGYLEIYEYPRGSKAIFTHTQDGRVETIEAGETMNALSYEVLDMEKAVSGAENAMCLEYTRDVMEMMSKLRKSWGLIYNEEQ